MNLKQLQDNWDAFGKIDPFWSILTLPDRKENKWEIDEFFTTGRVEIDEVMKYIESFCKSLVYRSALDFGCGVGRLTQALATYFDEVSGVDIAPSMIELAQRYNRHGDRCKYYLNETDELKFFRDSSYDFIYTRITLLHLEPKYTKGYIKEFLRILRPQGMLIFDLPGSICNAGRPIGKGLKQFVKSITPSPMLRLYRRIRGVSPQQPQMEEYAIGRQEISELLEESGARISATRDLMELGLKEIALLRERGIKVVLAPEEEDLFQTRRGVDYQYFVTKR